MKAEAITKSVLQYPYFVSGRLLVGLFWRDQIGLWEMIWAEVCQEAGHTRRDPLTSTEYVRTRPLAQWLRQVATKNGTANEMSYLELREVGDDHPMRDIISVKTTHED
jgi:hypothetical protein